MIYTRQFSESERRALNIIWTSSGDYNFESDFISFRPNGSPDFYLNCIIGFVHKWYNPEKIKLLFDSFNSYRLRDTFCDIAWFALENAAYQKEVAERPVLRELRRIHAQEFLDHEIDLHVAELMYRSSVVYDLHTARWSSVLGKHAPLLDPWESRLYKALAFGPEATTDQIISAIHTIINTYFIIRFKEISVDKKIIRLHINYTLIALLKMIFPSVRISSEYSGGIRNISSRKKNAAHSSLRKSGVFADFWNGNEAKDRKYIETSFGKPLFTDQKSTQLENELCTGNHLKSHVYFARGGEGTLSVLNSIQRQRNIAGYAEHRLSYEKSIHMLSTAVRDSMSLAKQQIPVRTSSGLLAPQTVWRSVYMKDKKIFTLTEEGVQSDFTVDLMLDASSSRSTEQETVAAQAYAIAKSLAQCNVQTQIYSFCTERGFTVLRLFKSYRSMNVKTIFDYTASGWNRDGLALKAALALMSRSESAKRLLIVLTDASPNDDHAIPPSGKIPFSTDYSGKKAVEDTAEAVRSLRKNHISVMAVVTGRTAESEEAAKVMYGTDFVRITDIGRFAGAVGTLLGRKIAEVE